MKNDYLSGQSIPWEILSYKLEKVKENAKQVIYIYILSCTGQHYLMLHFLPTGNCLAGIFQSVQFQEMKLDTQRKKFQLPKFI